MSALAVKNRFNPFLPYIPDIALEEDSFLTARSCMIPEGSCPVTYRHNPAKSPAAPVESVNISYNNGVTHKEPGEDVYDVFESADHVKLFPVHLIEKSLEMPMSEYFIF